MGLYLPGKNKLHSFKQYHFQDWPDFGIPDSSKPLVAFVDLLRGHEEADLQRVVVSGYKEVQGCHFGYISIRRSTVLPG